MKEILKEMNKLAKKAYKENKPPICAIVYDSNDNNKIIYKYINQKKYYGKKLKKSKYQNYRHAEFLIIDKIKKENILNEVKNYNLIITCPPCSNCMNKIEEEKIIFNKIEWLTFLGKQEDLVNFKKSTKYNFLEKIKYFGVIKLKVNEENLRISACYHWFIFKSNKYSKK